MVKICYRRLSRRQVVALHERTPKEEFKNQVLAAEVICKLKLFKLNLFSTKLFFDIFDI